MEKRFGLRVVSVAALGVCALLHGSAKAEHCWAYVDGFDADGEAIFPGWEYTRTPFTCVEEGNRNNSCSWQPGQACDEGTTCCTSIPNPGEQQSILAMHTEWHECFGNVGGQNPPLGRSARWLAFHRQFEWDFDLFREANFGCGPGECQGGVCSNDPDHSCSSDDECSAHDGCFIENIDWHPNMVFPYAHLGAGLSPGDHVAGCGTGSIRPANIECTNCRALPACLFMPGAGPISGDPPDPATSQSCLEFADVRLDEIPTVEDVSRVLDSTHHGGFHNQVGHPYVDTCSSNADCAHLPGTSTCDTQAGQCAYNLDVLRPQCSPRDPMFWRLHKRLDDTVRAWQAKRPFDLSVVIDRSESMRETDASGKTKIEVVSEALQMLADLLPDAQSSRIGVISHAGRATEDLPLTPAAEAAEAIESVAADLEGRAAGCTSVGSGLEAAVAQLCNGTSVSGKASCHPNDLATVEDGANARKAVLLLSDGLENRAPCLNSIGPEPTSKCGSQCGGEQLDQSLLGPHTELCAIGFGQAQSINGNLLTLLAERQGGIYMQSPAKGVDDQDGTSGQGRFVDLKDFFVKCFGQVSDEFVGVDPKGTLYGDQLSSEPMTYSTCSDDRLTFVAGWNTPQDDSVRLMVNAPNGDLVRFDDGEVEASGGSTWSFLRTGLPWHGEQAGTWRAQLIRPHNSYVNGFTTDALDPQEGEQLVRRQLQRLCPLGCESVLYFEDGQRGPQSSYAAALAAEQASGLLESVTVASDAADFDAKLRASQYSVIVYAHQMTEQVEPYDALLASRLCNGQRAIVTDTRGPNDPASGGYRINECASGTPAGFTNFASFFGDRRLIDGFPQLTNHGYATFSYALELGELYGSMQAWVQSSELQENFSVISTDTTRGCGGEFCPPTPDQEWFMDVLVRGLSELDDAPMRATFHTGESGIVAGVRVLPANVPQGGYDQANVRVEVERPAVGLGQTMIDVGQQADTSTPDADGMDGRAAALAATPPIQTFTQVLNLNDDGVAGDLIAGNAHWTAHVRDLDDPTQCLVDGMYKLYFKADFTKNGCTTRRELVRSTFVDVGVDLESSNVVTTPVAGGTRVDFCPQDRCGNPSGWGRRLTCGPGPDCSCGPEDIVDHGDGCYTVTVHATPGTQECTIGGAGKPLEIPRFPACVVATRNLTPRDGSFVAANMHAGSLTIGTDSMLIGSAFVGNSGSIGHRSVFEGDMTLGGVLSGNRAGVHGVITEHLAPSLPQLERRTFSVGSGSSNVNNGAIVTLDPGARGNMTFRARSVVTLNPGTYTFASLNIEPDVIVHALGTVQINVQGSLQVGDRSSVLGQSPQELVLYSNASQLRIGTDVRLTGMVVAPNATINVYSRTDVVGCLGGRDVNLEPDVSIEGSGAELPVAP